MIPENLLLQYKAELKSYNKDELILKKDFPAHVYFQIKTGVVSMFDNSEDGKEFILGIFKDHQSFAEPPLFGNFNYPAYAKAISDSELYVLPKKQLLNLFKNHFDIHLKFNEILSKRIRYKSMILSEISMHNPSHQLKTLLNYLKLNAETTNEYEVTLTRQQLADLTGLRVETVIRTLKKLKDEGEIKIKNRKVYV